MDDPIDRRLSELERQVDALLEEMNQSRERGALRRIRVIPERFGKWEIGDHEGTLDLSPMAQGMGFDTDGGGGPGGPSIGAATCVSRSSGAAELRGWSKIDNWNDGDLNTRKALRCDFTQPEYPPCFNVQRSCNAAELEIIGIEEMRPIEPTALHSPTTDDVTQYATWERYYCDTASGDVLNNSDGLPTTASAGATDRSCGNLMGASASIVVNDDWTTTTTYASNSGLSSSCDVISQPDGCADCDPVTPGNDAFYTCGPIARDAYIVTCALSVFDTVAAALERASGTVGSLCRTTVAEIDTTSAGSRFALGILDTVSVTVTQPLSGMVNGQAYEIDMVLKRYTAGGGGYVDDITVTVAFTAGAASEDLTYEVPVNTDYDYEFDHAENLVAV